MDSKDLQIYLDALNQRANSLERETITQVVFFGANNDFTVHAEVDPNAVQQLQDTLLNYLRDKYTALANKEDD